MVRQPFHVAAVMLALALGSFGCDPIEYTDEGQYSIAITLEQPMGSSSHHVLVGSTFRLDIRGVVVEGEVDEDGGGLDCATQSGSGVVVELDDDEFLVEAAGNGTVELADPGESCPVNDDILAELGPDRWSVIGVEPTDVIGRWAYEPDSAIAFYRSLLSPGPRGEFPEVLGRPLDDLRVVAGSQFEIRPALVGASDGGDVVEVRWSEDDLELIVPAHYDELRPRTDEGEVLQRLEGTLTAGETIDASATVLGTSFHLPPVHAVPIEHITSLELVPIYEKGDAQREWGPPALVVAIARDGEGRRVIHAPVEFEVADGRLHLEHATTDLIYVGGTCRVPAEPTARFATVAATLGQLEASVDLEWIALPSDTKTDGQCEGACTCTSAPTGESAPALLALVCLGLWLRRRPSCRQDGFGRPGRRTRESVWFPS